MHPVAFELGPLTIHWYGIMIALAFLAGVWTAGRRGLRHGINPHHISDAALWLLIGAIIGARALHVISYWEEFEGRGLLEIFKIQKGGLVFYGGVIGALMAGALFVWKTKLPFFKLADAIAPSIALGSAFGRIGCLMTGCCYGAQCSLPWAIRFPDDHPTHGVPVHPTQLYDAFANLLLYFGLAWLYRRKKLDGQVLAVWLIGYSVLRSTVEMFRGDYGAHRLGVFTPAQLVSVVIVLAGVALLVWLSRAQARQT